jgi:xanthine dehydrogenase small subunit
VIEFILNHDLVQLDDLQADITLLDFLRLDKRLDKNLKGTKEGCASGDCGACTVVIAEPTDSNAALSYKSINSCICLLGSLHGKQVITVDALREGDDLHPVQQAMVDEHGSQCGFCTPGFVMSLFALSKQQVSKQKISKQKVSKNNMTADRGEVVENIDGNLCRCTGYRPIIDAGVSILNQSFTDEFDRKHQDTLDTLKSINRAESTNFFIPETIESLAQLTHENPDARLLAGGTDLGLDVTQGLQQLEKVIYLGQVKELKKISETDENIVIGASVTYQECADLLSREYPTLQNLIHRFASTQIRNVGTVGGNVANASPIGDMPPVLVALDCSLVLHKKGEERTVKIDDFYTGYKQTVMQEGEFLRDIIIPKNKLDHTLSVHKISKRHADDISAICAAFYIHVVEDKIDNIRIGMGGMAATVKRATNCENYLKGQLLNRETLEQAKIKMVTDFEPMSDVRATSEYRVLMAQNVLERLFLEQGAKL